VFGILYDIENLEVLSEMGSVEGINPNGYPTWMNNGRADLDGNDSFREEIEDMRTKE